MKKIINLLLSIAASGIGGYMIIHYYDWKLFIAIMLILTGNNVMTSFNREPKEPKLEDHYRDIIRNLKNIEKP